MSKLFLVKEPVDNNILEKLPVKQPVILSIESYGQAFYNPNADTEQKLNYCRNIAHASLIRGYDVVVRNPFEEDWLLEDFLVMAKKAHAEVEYVNF